MSPDSEPILHKGGPPAIPRQASDDVPILPGRKTEHKPPKPSSSQAPKRETKPKHTKPRGGAGKTTKRKREPQPKRAPKTSRASASPSSSPRSKKRGRPTGAASPKSTGQAPTGDLLASTATPRAKSPTPDDGNERVCRICHTPGPLVCCEGCPAAYHSGCYRPRISDTRVHEQLHWFCQHCTKEAYFEKMKAMSGAQRRSAISKAPTWLEQLRTIKKEDVKPRQDISVPSR